MSAIKEYNLKRHYDTKHAAMYASLQGQSRTDKQNHLRKSLIAPKIFKKVATEADGCVKVSYVIAQKIAKKSKAFSGGEFEKNLVSAAEYGLPTKYCQFGTAYVRKILLKWRLMELLVWLGEKPGW